MTLKELSGHPHRRRNILAGEWVLVSPHRNRRPWQGKVETRPAARKPAYDPNCYLCPGNARADGSVNPGYKATFAFDNDYPALLPDVPSVQVRDGLLQAEAESGACRVVCFSPRHDLTLAEMDVQDVLKVVDLWTHEYLELGGHAEINYVQIFENKGEMMGCSNPHPHGQIWAQKTVPGEPARELANMQRHYEKTGRPLLIDYLTLEIEREERLVCYNEAFAAIVPFWAVWPFEVLVLPRRQVGRLTDLSTEEREGLADIIRRITVRYDNLFEVAFPYSSGFHQWPTDGQEHPGCTLHMHFYPPLLRSARIRKFMVGYEMLGDAQRDITPETAAALLRDQSDSHYSHGSQTA